MGSERQYKSDGNQPVDRRILFNAIMVVALCLGSYILRELYPEQPLIKWLFGGIRILIFWTVSAYLIHRIDILIFGKKNQLKYGNTKPQKDQGRD